MQESGTTRCSSPGEIQTPFCSIAIELELLLFVVEAILLPEPSHVLLLMDGLSVVGAVRVMLMLE